MPIRTNRGRAAVYRKLWGWPMRSPRHLVATALVFLAVVLTVGLIVPRLTGSGGTSGGAAVTIDSETGSPDPTSGSGQLPGRQPTSTAPNSLPTRITSPPQTPTSAPPAPKALEIATLWAKAWVNHPEGVTNDAWRDGLREYTTEEQLAVMASVDPVNIPATEVTGPAAATTSYTSSVEVKIPTDGGALSMTVIATPQGWRVARYDLAV